MQITGRVSAVAEDNFGDRIVVTIDPFTGGSFVVKLPRRLLATYQIGRVVDVTLTPQAKIARRAKR